MCAYGFCCDDGWGVVGAEGGGGRVGMESTSVCARGRFGAIER